jgi:hypothetical protein
MKMAHYESFREAMEKQASENDAIVDWSYVASNRNVLYSDWADDEITRLEQENRELRGLLGSDVLDMLNDVMTGDEMTYEVDELITTINTKLTPQSATPEKEEPDGQENEFGPVELGEPDKVPEWAIRLSERHNSEEPSSNPCQFPSDEEIIEILAKMHMDGQHHAGCKHASYGDARAEAEAQWLRERMTDNINKEV